MQDYRSFMGKVLISEARLQRRVRELATQINADYRGQDDLMLVCILRGGITFMVDLMRHLTIPHTMDCMAISSYDIGTRASTGNVRLTLDLKTNIEAKPVLLVEDIVDSGYTIASVLQILETRKPRSLQVCALLDKAERREVAVPIHYRGFTIPDQYVFGYGLDIDEYYRNLPFVATADLEKYRPPV